MQGYKFNNSLFNYNSSWHRLLGRPKKSRSELTSKRNDVLEKEVCRNYFVKEERRGCYKRRQRTRGKEGGGRERFAFLYIEFWTGPIRRFYNGYLLNWASREHNHLPFIVSNCNHDIRICFCIPIRAVYIGSANYFILFTTFLGQCSILRCWWLVRENAVYVRYSKGQLRLQSISSSISFHLDKMEFRCKICRFFPTTCTNFQMLLNGFEASTLLGEKLSTLSSFRCHHSRIQPCVLLSLSSLATR